MNSGAQDKGAVSGSICGLDGSDYKNEEPKREMGAVGVSPVLASLILAADDVLDCGSSVLVRALGE